ncbi:LytR/AlgR family response regulator transcription factor [Scatolibacter rhodanostii]|uniref:LytR/AlgR family response regulator transcription factor n=1 Tax=Scatolibacter rhodanostii TaxID=2014781 RepID=UPI000C07C09B|nr:LytTR family DNA-binding domain-containing protein [Scatolibacter rhodanostii]
MKIKLVLVEENDQIRFELKDLLLFYNVFDIVAEFTKLEDIIQFTDLNQIDAVFTNVRLGSAKTSGDGFYLSVYLTQQYPDLMVVTYADTKEYAYHAFKHGCLEYFALPFDSLVMQRVVNRLVYQHSLLQYKNESVNRSVMIKTKTGYQLKKINDILFVERSNRKNRLVTVDGNEIILAGYTMDEIEKMLGTSGFYRCYQSFIVNLSKVSFIKANAETKNYSLLFENYAGEIMLSRDKYAEVVSILKERYAKISM